MIYRNIFGIQHKSMLEKRLTSYRLENKVGKLISHPIELMGWNEWKSGRGLLKSCSLDYDASSRLHLSKFEQRLVTHTWGSEVHQQIAQLALKNLELLIYLLYL